MDALARYYARRRRAAYQSGKRPSIGVSAYVVAVGNLTVGGAGKTPTVIDLAQRLRRENISVGIVSRGYRGQQKGPLVAQTADVPSTWSAREIGDEPALMAQRLPGVPLAIGADRVGACNALIEATGVELILLDDGFSHLRLRRDLDIVLIHGPLGLGNGKMLPFGPLREPIEHLDRAGALVITKGPLDPAWKSRLAPWLESRPLFSWSYRIESITRLDAPTPIPIEEIRNSGPALAVSALGDNDSFATLLGREKIEAVSMGFADHADISKRWRTIEKRADKIGAKSICITEKDAIKWPTEIPSERIAVVRAGIAWDNPEALVGFIKKRMER